MVDSRSESADNGGGGGLRFRVALLRPALAGLLLLPHRPGRRNTYTGLLRRASRQEEPLLASRRSALTPRCCCCVHRCCSKPARAATRRFCCCIEFSAAGIARSGFACIVTAKAPRPQLGPERSESLAIRILRPPCKCRGETPIVDAMGRQLSSGRSTGATL